MTSLRILACDLVLIADKTGVVRLGIRNPKSSGVVLRAEAREWGLPPVAPKTNPGVGRMTNEW